MAHEQHFCYQGLEKIDRRKADIDRRYVEKMKTFHTCVRRVNAIDMPYQEMYSANMGLAALLKDKKVAVH